jgi:hypothetical protein
VANARGAILTIRDRALLSYVGIARYATADQVHRLFFEGRSKKQTYRRLAKLCAPGGGLGQGACLRRLEFRRSEGTGVPVWALSSYGRGIAAECVPYLRPPAAQDIGHRFLEHTLLLNEVLVELVLKLRAFDLAPLDQLPFRWHAEDDETLQFTRHVGPGHARATSVLKPDAILEVPGRKGRLFLEAETGTQSIATANPARSGAVLVKVRRYADFFIGRSDRAPATWYRAAFPDGFTPQVVFLVHSKERKVRVEAAVAGELTRGHHEYFKVLVLTFAEAASVLAPFVTKGLLDSTRVATRQRLIAVDDTRMNQLKTSYNALAVAWNAARRQRLTAGGTGTPTPLDEVPVDALKALLTLLQDIEAAGVVEAPATRAADPR